MAYTNFIQPSLPPDTNESPSLGASRIRSLKSALIERLNSWIYGFDTAGEESKKGLKEAPFQEESKPTAEANVVKLYNKATSGKSELYCLDEDDNEVQITSGGILANVGDYATKNLNQEYLATENTFVHYANADIFRAVLITIASDLNFASVVYSGRSAAVAKKGYYYKQTSLDSGTYQTITI